MKISGIIIFTLSLLGSTQTLALNLVEFKKPVDDKLYDSRSCNDLYMEAIALEKQSFSYAADKDDRTLMASAVSTIFTPALYLVGYNAIQDYKQKIEAKSTFDKIESVRFRMAEKRCFEK